MEVLLGGFVFLLFALAIKESQTKREAKKRQEQMRAALEGNPEEKPKKPVNWLLLGVVGVAALYAAAEPANRPGVIGLVFLAWAVVRFFQCIVALVQDVPVKDPKRLTDLSGVIVVSFCIYACKDNYPIVFPALAGWLLGRYLMRRVAHTPPLQLDAFSPFILLAECALYTVMRQPREARYAAIAFGAWMVVLVVERVRRSRSGVHHARTDSDRHTDAGHVVKPVVGRPWGNAGSGKFVGDLPPHIRQLFDAQGKGKRNDKRQGP